MARVTIHIGGREQLRAGVNKGTPLGALPTEALVWFGSTQITGSAAALRGLASELTHAAALADQYDADPDAWNQHERAAR